VTKKLIKSPFYIVNDDARQSVRRNSNDRIRNNRILICYQIINYPKVNSENSRTIEKVVKTEKSASDQTKREEKLFAYILNRWNDDLMRCCFDKRMNK